MDCGLTPQILVNALYPGVDVPSEFITDGTVVFNIHDLAVSRLDMKNDYISFSARFGGVPREIYVPVESVVGIYTRENGQGMFFETPGSPDDPGTDPSEDSEDSQSEKPEKPEVESSTPTRRKPDLRIV